MKVPKPSTRLSKEVESIGSLPRGTEWIEWGMALSKKICLSVKHSLSESQGASFLSSAFSDEALISQTIEANVLAVIGRLLHGFEQLREKQPYFISECFASALTSGIEQLDSERTKTANTPTFTTLFDEIFDLLIKLAFPQGADDLILPVEGMAASLIRSFIWKMLVENLKKESKGYFDKLTSLPSREQFFYWLLLQLEKGMKGQNIVSLSTSLHPSAEEVEVVRKALSNFILRYIKSISPSLFQERQQSILNFAQPISSKVAPIVLQLCSEDYILSLLQNEWKMGASLPPLESAILDKIALISRDREGLIRIITSAMAQQPSAAAYKEHLHSGREALKFIITEGAKSFSVEMFASAVVDKLQEDSWLERFLGAWYLALRSQAHTFILIEGIRNILQNITHRLVG